jgi:hypothetical protein
VFPSFSAYLVRHSPRHNALQSVINVSLPCEYAPDMDFCIVYHDFSLDNLDRCGHGQSIVLLALVYVVSFQFVFSFLSRIMFPIK